MATNYVQPGSVVTLTAPYQRNAGQGALVGSLFGVALATVANAVEGEFQLDGLWSLAKTSAQAWTQGQKIYWDDANKRCDSDSTLGQLIGVASEAAANPSSTGKVRLNGSSPATAEGAQAAVADLTDSSGGAAADGTIGAVTAPTALTDSGGGTADGTVSAQAEPVTLTDSTGDSGTHDDTLADGLTSVAPAAYSAHAAGAVAVTSNAATDLDTTAAAVANLRGVVATLVTDMATQNQNDSDLAQKVIELVTLAGVAQDNLKELTTAQGQDRTAIVALTDAVKELSTKVNATLAALRAAGIISA